ncbi:hypothetical protein [Streptomyces litmocidini]|uniref:Uncharacterized protein n=1 Tax=Streptomyces litmocidini TaxID=67318 RepID=A0ABW7U2V6_9ACTN
MIRLSGDDWTGSKSNEWHVEQPSSGRIEEAVQSLDGRKKTEVTVSDDDPFRFISVSGGPDLFLVTGEMEDGAITHLQSSAENNQEVRLVCGGQLGVYQRSDLVTLDDAVRAVRDFLNGFPEGLTADWLVE